MPDRSAAHAADRGSMRAVVLYAPRRMEVRAVRLEQPAPHEVLVRVRAVGLCGTDFHIFEGHANYTRDEAGRAIPLTAEPQILGHEIAGEIEEVGSAVRELRPGEAVVVDQGRTCVGEGRSPVCEYCATGDSHQCEFYREHGITGLPGGFAEYVVVPAANAVPVQTGLAASSAALTEPVGCIVHSCDLLGRASARYSFAGRAAARIRTVLVVGGGVAGLLFVQYIRNVLGFEGTLLVSEPDPWKRELAERFGAESIDPLSSDLVPAVLDATHGRRAELLIDASGVGSLYETIPGLIRKQATVLMYGHGHDGVDLSVLNSVQFMEPALVAPAGASGGFEPDGRPSTYVKALRLIEEGRIVVEPLITHRYASLDAVPAAFAGEESRPGYIKAVLML